MRHTGYLNENESGDRPIYLNENLTSTNFNIFRESLKLKNTGKIKSTFTSRGLVYIKKTDAEEPIHIEFLDQLNRIFR